MGEIESLKSQNGGVVQHTEVGKANIASFGSHSVTIECPQLSQSIVDTVSAKFLEAKRANECSEAIAHSVTQQRFMPSQARLRRRALKDRLESLKVSTPSTELEVKVETVKDVAEKILKEGEVERKSLDSNNVAMKPNIRARARRRLLKEGLENKQLLETSGASSVNGLESKETEQEELKVKDELKEEPAVEDERIEDSEKESEHLHSGLGVDVEREEEEHLEETVKQEEELKVKDEPKEEQAVEDERIEDSEKESEHLHSGLGVDVEIEEAEHLEETVKQEDLETQEEESVEKSIKKPKEEVLKKNSVLDNSFSDDEDEEEVKVQNRTQSIKSSTSRRSKRTVSLDNNSAVEIAEMEGVPSDRYSVDTYYRSSLENRHSLPLSTVMSIEDRVRAQARKSKENGIIKEEVAHLQADQDRLDGIAKRDEALRRLEVVAKQERIKKEQEQQEAELDVKPKSGLMQSVKGLFKKPVDKNMQARKEQLKKDTKDLALLVKEERELLIRQRKQEIEDVKQQEAELKRLNKIKKKRQEIEKLEAKFLEKQIKLADKKFKKQERELS